MIDSLNQLTIHLLGAPELQLAGTPLALHHQKAHTLYHLAELFEKQGKQEQARSLYQQALSIREQALGSDHPDTIATREALAKLHDTQHTL